MKRLGIILLTVLMAFLPLTPAKAESVLLNGQTQYYTVQLRSDKQAIVYARIIFENASSDANLSTYEFSLPSGVSVSNLSAQQILAKSTTSVCKTYETLEEWRTRTGLSSSSTYDTSRKCLMQDTTTAYDDDYDYANNISGSTAYYYYSYYQQRDSKFEYVDLKQSSTNGTYSVTLSEPLKPKKQGSLLLTFTTRDFVSGGLFGRYTYNVRTLLAKQMIDKTTVSVNFDTDMFTREATQQRTYDTSISTSANQTSGTDSAGSTYKSKSMDSLIGTIGTGGLYVKTQSSLLPGDTLSVTGVFATNSLVLFMNELLVGLLLLALLAIGIGLYRIWRKGHPTHKQHLKETTRTVPTADGLGTIATTSWAPAWKVIILTSCISIVGTLVLVFALGTVLSNDISGSSTSSMIAVFSIIAVGLFGGVIAPLLYMLRFGIEDAFRWALIHVALIAVLLLSFSALSGMTNSTNDKPRYYDYDTLN